MKSGKTGKASLAAETPEHLVLEKLRDHFRRAYLLNDIQVETMMVSSSKSLQQALASAHELLQGTEKRAGFTLLFHNLKGLLLNMGESDWAAYIKELENRLTDGTQVDYSAAIGVIEKGLFQILSYADAG